MTRFRPALALEYFFSYIPYLSVTFSYVLGALIVGIVFGALLAWAKLGKSRIFRFLASLYTALMRSIPNIVMLYLVYYLVPAVLRQSLGINISKENTLGFTILAMGLFQIATMSEIMKSAWQSVSRGQYEAAVCSGIPPAQAVLRIVLPQAFQVAIPNLGNDVIRLIKNGSLAYAIGLIDIMGYAYFVNKTKLSNDISEVFLSLALLYWLLSIVLDQLFKLLEKKTAYGLHGVLKEPKGKKRRSCT